MDQQPLLCDVILHHCDQAMMSLVEWPCRPSKSGCVGVQSTCDRTRGHSKRGSSFWVSEICVKEGEGGKDWGGRGRKGVGRAREEGSGEGEGGKDWGGRGRKGVGKAREERIGEKMGRKDWGGVKTSHT